MTHVLPALPYRHSALEPVIDARTMVLHHDVHHAGYVANLNAAIANHPELHDKSETWLLLNLNKVPGVARNAVRDSAGGHVNHSLLWRAMSPKGGGTPGGRLAEAIAREFGGFEKFKAQFEEAGTGIFGSGWVWLVRAQQNGGRLMLSTTVGHGNPMMQGHFPLLVNDVWEHAYYLKHGNRRAQYLHDWWALVDWEEAARRFALSDHAATNHWAAEGELLLKAS